ncbi:MAG: AAA family ATPase [Candidatus Xenobiia bacterium LiM19]
MISQKRFFMEELKLINYRCFSEVSLRFDEQLTVFVAPNGGGKTAVLDGAAVALRLFVDTMEGRANSKGFDSKDIHLVMTPVGMMEQITPVRLEASGYFLGGHIDWACERQSEMTSRTAIVKTGNLKNIAYGLLLEDKEWLRDKEWFRNKKTVAPIFPLISYYGTGRLWSSPRLKEGKKIAGTALNARHRGYTDCLSSSSHYKSFVDWFRRFSYEAKRESPMQPESPHEPQQVLNAIRNAVDLALAPSGWHELTWDFAEDTIVAHHKDYGRLPVDILSDGIRNMIGLVADIAHRASRLNPHLKENAAIETPGIVLIDEVDMHLHPGWQQVVIRSLLDAFPLIQFIVTTHSPQVLTTIRKENIRILARDWDDIWTASMPELSPLAHESGDALAHILGTNPRPLIASLLEYIYKYEELARSGQLDSNEALQIKKKLNDAGFEFDDAEMALFNFLQRKNLKPEVEEQ